MGKKWFPEAIKLWHVTNITWRAYEDPGCWAQPPELSFRRSGMEPRRSPAGKSRLMLTCCFGARAPENNPRRGILVLGPERGRTCWVGQIKDVHLTEESPRSNWFGGSGSTEYGMPEAWIGEALDASVAALSCTCHHSLQLHGPATTHRCPGVDLCLDLPGEPLTIFEDEGSSPTPSGKPAHSITSSSPPQKLAATSVSPTSCVSLNYNTTVTQACLLLFWLVLYSLLFILLPSSAPLKMSSSIYNLPLDPLL